MLKKYGTNYTDFGKWARHFCVDHDLTLQQFGQIIGLHSPAAIGEVCKGRMRLPQDTKSLLMQNYELKDQEIKTLNEAIEKDPSVLLYKIKHLANKLTTDDLETINAIIKKYE
jgi:hypothetical protein